MRSQKLNPEAFLGVKILTPMEQDRVRGGLMRTVQQQQQQQQDPYVPLTPQTPETPQTVIV